jgi:hypothetical protein
MPTPYESARLNLQIFDLRREPVLREARSWFVMDFNPGSFEELMAGLREHNTRFRMVVGYWEMAASMVTSGAIDHGSFLAAHTEIVATFAKLHPYIKELRSTLCEPKMLCHMEQVVLGMPDAEATLERRRTSLAAAAKARKARQEQPSQ